MIAAIYARKSTEQRNVDDESKSVARQIDNARAFAGTRGWRVEHVFSDDAVSGAETKKLVNRQRMLDLIHSGRPPFQVLVMRDQSRFSRRDADEAFGELKRITEAGVEVWFYHEQKVFRFGTFEADVSGLFSGLLNAEERRRGSQRTTEAMESQFTQGHHMGGRVFGYAIVDVDNTGKPCDRFGRSHSVLKVNDAEAVVVRRIFELYAAGRGLPTIAKALNEERALSPRAQQGRPNGWVPSSVRTVLYRETYHGVTVYRASKKRNLRGEVQQRRRPVHEQMRKEMAHLRIVPDAVWQAVQARLTETRIYALRLSKGRLAAGPPPIDVLTGGRPTKSRVPYLLSGIARCTCGAGLEAFKRPWQQQYVYCCQRWRRAGKMICANTLQVPIEVADEAVLGAIERAVFRPEVVDAVVTKALAVIKAAQAGNRYAEVERDLAEVTRALVRLTTAIAAGGGELMPIVEEIRRYEARRKVLETELVTLAGQRRKVDPAQVEKWMRERLTDWRGLLRRHPAQGRQVLQKVLTDRLVFEPQPEGFYTFRGTAVLDKVLRGNLGDTTGWRPHTGTIRLVDRLNGRSQRPDRAMIPALRRIGWPPDKPVSATGFRRFLHAEQLAEAAWRRHRRELDASS